MKRVVVLLSVTVLALAVVLGVGASSRGQPHLDQLWDIEAIKQAQYTYAYNVDHGNLDGVMAVFSEDAIAEYALPGYPPLQFVGKEAIEVFLGAFVFPGNPITHVMVMPYIVVDGKKASGVFYLWNISNPGVNCEDSEGDVGFIRGWYNNEYEKVKGEWKITHLRFSAEVTGTLQGCNYDGPWEFEFPPSFEYLPAP